MTGLIRGESKAEHRSNGKAILGEMGKERISSSETLNPERTPLNVYEQENSSGFSMWDDMVERANTYKQAVPGKTKNGEEITRYRGLRKDAVIGAAIIINPPYEECRNWSEEEYQKFYDDTRECLAEFRPEIFRRTNQVFGVEHRDEGYDDNDRHMHAVYDAIDENGRYCGNRLDAKFLSDFNKSYPKMMRSKGWEMDDLDTTDWERYKTDPTYKAERDAKRRSQGKSVNQHIRNKMAENFRKSDEILKEAQQIQDEKEALEHDIETLRVRKRKLKDEVATTLTEANSDAQTIRDEAKAQAEKDLEERDAALTKEFLDVVGDVTGYEYDPESTTLDDVKKDLHDWGDDLQKYEDETLDKLNKARVALKDAKALESNSDSATLERAREFMRTTQMPNSTTTVLASFEAHESLSGYGKKPRRTRAQIQSDVNDLYNRINQRQHSDDSYGY
jgi:uncharacterized protein YdcH (DUF465 family)